MNRYKIILFLLLFSFVAKAQKPDGDLLIKNLPDTVLSGNRTLLVPGSFDGMAALRKLFPGKYYNLEASGYKDKLISWECKSCKPKKYEDVNGVEDNPVFPFEGGVATRMITVIDLSDANGKQYKMLAFNHSVYDPDGMQTGRFSGGLLGLAKFTKTDSGWLLRSFDPAVAAYGAFASCPTPQVIKIGDDQFAFYLRHLNGGAGGPYDESFFVIAGANGKYSQVLATYGEGRTDGMDDQSSWSSELSVPESDKKYFRDIVIKTKGKYIMADEGEVKIDEIHDKMKGFKSCAFSYTIRFVYSASKGYQAGRMEDLVITNKK
ncbi:hypothetical protein [Taibaiella soli]|uniref:Uncharacterized protein n=1 Tax=Taibaiella soli TaxID=1649169 RepID=A0A2W2ADI9_9BACT|nr:hypothetical protein [Taibaiella soli]PZF73505.1 hypothetical protein DN068_07205 [Taibaiella soli]